MGASDRQLKHAPLDPDEQVVESWIAGVLYGKRSSATKVGGSLVLTDRRLLFVPVKLPIGMATWRDQRWIDGYGFAFGLDEVRVEADPERRAAIRVTGPEGTMALGIAASRFTPVFSKKNVAVRDTALATITAATTG